MSSKTSSSIRQKLHVISSSPLSWFRNLKKKTKKMADDYFEEGGEKKGGAAIRTVKVMLTKKEAVRLLALYVGGEDELLAGVVGQLENRETRRRIGASYAGAWKPMLESIPED